MAAVDHRAEAEKHLANAARHLTEDDRDMRIAEVAAVIGQGHAALARDEEHAVTTADLRDALALHRRRNGAMRELVSTHIAKALASREAPRWKAGRDLAQALDEADANMDDLIDARLTDDGWDARSAWKTPGSAVPAADPWAARKEATVEVPEKALRALAIRIADGLLNTDGEVRQFARGVAFELKHAGADLTDAIQQHIHDLTLGRDPEDPPF